MLITDNALQFKKSIKKKRSQDFAIKFKLFLENNHPEDLQFIKKMERQIKCLYRFDEYDDGTIQSYYCGEKTCEVCNPNRLGKHINKYLPVLEKLKHLYHMVLTIKNPHTEELKMQIDKMYNFFQNSSIRKDKRYKELNKSIKLIRSFECKIKNKTKTYNIHFHILLSGNVEEEVLEYGHLLTNYWLMYFRDLAHEDAQYIEKQKKSPLENFKYLTKMNDINEINYEMFYHLLKAIHNRRIFTAKNFGKRKYNADQTKRKSKDAKFMRSHLFIKDNENNINYVNFRDGEILITEEKEKAYKDDLQEKKNLSELRKYFALKVGKKLF